MQGEIGGLALLSVDFILVFRCLPVANMAELAQQLAIMANIQNKVNKYEIVEPNHHCL